jgi:hypothetical protein
MYGSAGSGRLQRRLQDQLGLLERIVLAAVAQALQEPDIPWQGELADPTKPPQIGFEQGKQTFRPILMLLTTAYSFFV